MNNTSDRTVFFYDPRTKSQLKFKGLINIICDHRIVGILLSDLNAIYPEQIALTASIHSNQKWTILYGGNAEYDVLEERLLEMGASITRHILLES